MNSKNHRSEGQNVLFNEGSVQWCKTPFVGYARDNIYTHQDLDPAQAAWIWAAESKYDSVLLPFLPIN